MLQDCIADSDWAKMYIVGQENGLGAVRSFSMGDFDVEWWDRIPGFKGERVIARKSTATAAEKAAEKAALEAAMGGPDPEAWEDEVPDDKARHRILVENPATLYDFPKGG